MQKSSVRKPRESPSFQSVAPEIWEAVCANDKKAVYRYIVTSETDINTVFQQASSSSSLTLAKVMLLQEQTIHNQSCSSERSSTSSLNLGSAGDSQRMDYFEGCTLLHLACETADIGMLELLLQYGANVNAVDSGGNMPLHRCILRGRAANAKMLLARWADPQALNDEGKTPLELAVESSFGDNEVLTLLSDTNG